MILGFVHVPKTGGSLINSSNFLKPNPTICNNRGHAKVSELLQHNHSHELISVVRNPYQQSISKYYHMKRNHKGEMNFSLEDFLTNKDHRMWSEISYSIYYDSMTPKDFSFIGVTSQMPKNRIILHTMFNFRFYRMPYNVNPLKKFDQPYKTTFYKKEFEKIYKQDYDLYYEGVDKFNQLCKKYL